MGTKLNYDQKGRLSDRLDELSRVTKNGTRDFEQVMSLLQSAIEGKFPEVIVPSINWTPVAQYADKLRDWNERFKLGLTEAQITDLVLPDHAGPLQPTGISLSLGKGLKGDRKVVQEIIKYELGKLGVAFTDYLEDVKLSYFPGSEPAKSKTPQLVPALLDIGSFWDSQNGIVPREVREQFRGRPLPALEVDWLMALNPQVFAAIDYKTFPGLIAAGLVVGSEEVPGFDRGSGEACVYGHWDDNRWYAHAVAVFREC